MLRIKFITKNHGAGDWLRQIPGGVGQFGGCQFIFDSSCRDYDWLVVYDDFPKFSAPDLAYRFEPLACPVENTILVTSEPESIKRYESAYTRQFGCVITSQSEKGLKHPNAIRAPSTSLWYYGQGGAERKTVDLISQALPSKTQQLSTVCSDKKQKHTLHFKRWIFTQAIKQALPELDIFGHGVRPMRDKAEAMDDYRYHIAIENHFGAHHWTEKLSDCYLAGCLPFYYGCPNAEKYFPADSFIRIDINDIEGAIEIIREALANDAYSKCKDAVVEARRRVLEQHNLFVRLEQMVCSGDLSGTGSLKQRLYSRHAARLRSPIRTLIDLI